MRVRPMSALPSIADIAERDGHVRFVPEADSCTAAILSLFDHLVGAGKQRWWHFEAERLGGHHIDRQIETCRRLER